MRLSFTCDQNLSITSSLNIVGLYSFFNQPISDEVSIEIESNIEWTVEFNSSNGNFITLRANYSNGDGRYIDVVYSGSRNAAHNHPVIGRLLAQLVPTARLVSVESSTPEVPWYTTKAIESGLELDRKDRDWNHFSYWRHLVNEKEIVKSGN